ncbi:MAG: CheR family methyltransferase [Sedimentisphaeraceae bacterium JB056]
MNTKQQITSNSSYNVLIRHIEDELGATFSKIREKHLVEILNNIAEDAGFKNIDEYANWLLETSDSSHIEEFAKHLTIGESYFFRHYKTFVSLKNKIIPDITKRGSKKIKVWCAGCSCGQEPYTIAMVLDELGLTLKNQVSITGSDINNDFLKQAKNAEYTEWSFREMPPKYLEKYFTKAPNENHKLTAKIRNIVDFQNINLHNSTYPFNDLDIIFCRNVLIYFSQSQIDKITERLLNILKPGGWLITAPSEVPLINDTNLELVQDNGLFFFRKRNNTLYSEDLFISAVEHLSVDTTPIKTPTISSEKKFDYQISQNNLKKLSAEKKNNENISNHSSLKEIIDLLISGKYEDAVSKLTTAKNIKIKSGEYLELAIKLADCGQFKNALKCIETALKEDKLNTDIIYQKAVILNAMNRNDQAKKSFEQVLFLSPDHIAAYFSLGTMLLKSDKKSAEKKLQVAIKLSQRLNDDEIISGTRDLTKQDLKLFVQNCCNIGENYEC